MPFFSSLTGKTGYEAVSEDLPTITNGIASGFDDTTGIQTNLDFTPGNADEWEIHTCVNISDVRSPYQMVIGTRGFGMDFTLDGNRRCNLYLSSTGNSWNIAYGTKGTFVTPLNEWTYYKLKKTRTKFIVYCSLDGSNWSEDISVNMTDQIKCNNARVGIGYLNPGNAAYLRGSLDLNKTYIKINNTPWFGKCPVRVKVNSGLARYSKIGNSVTISNGIASGFSSGNSIKLNGNFNPGTNDWEGVIKVKFNSSIPNTWRLLCTAGETNGLGFLIGSNAQKKLQIWISTKNDTYWRYSGLISNNEILTVDTWYWLKYGWDKTYYYIEYSTDGVNYTRVIQQAETKQISTLNSLFIGRDGSGKYTIGNTASIDLNESYIKVSGSYFWRGDKQNTNSYKIHQDTFSKYYTIIDGKLVWANPNIYLESTGTQYIDTGIKPTSSMTMQVSMSSAKESSVGSRVAAYNSAFVIYNRTSNAWFALGNYTNQPYQVNIDTTKKHIYTLSSPKTSCYIDNELKSSTLTSFNGNNYNIWLFGMNNGGSVVESIYRTGKIFNFKLWETNLIQHLVPVPKGLLIGNFVVPSNGMFDIVTQTFYGNAGTGEFKIGGIPDDYIIEGGKMIWCNQEISLICPGGSNRIDTNIPLYQLSGKSLNVELSFKSGYSDIFAIGARNTARLTFGVGWERGNFAIAYGNCSKQVTEPSVYFDSKVSVKYTPSNSMINGTLVKGTVYSGTESGWGEFSESKDTSTICVGAENQAGTIRSFVGRVYNFYIFDIDKVYIYLVPVPKGILIGDKIAPSNCMFDLVTQTFFENQGTGEFTIGGLSSDYIIVGDDVVWCNPDIYLRAKGTNNGGPQYIDTGLKLSNTSRVKVDFQFNVNSSWLFAADNNDDGYPRFGFIYSSGKHFAPVWYGANKAYEVGTSRFDKNTVDFNKVNVTLNKTEYTYSAFTNRDFTTTQTCYLFANHRREGSVDQSAQYDAQIYNCLMYNNDKLKRYFIPVTTNMQISGTTIPAPGMWDMVTKKFFGNKGTGSFTYGKDS